MRDADLTVFVSVYVGRSPEAEGRSGKSSVRFRHADCLGLYTARKKLDDLLVYRKAVLGAKEVSALLAKPAFGKNFDLRDQLSGSSGRIPGHIGEGHGQLTDRHFASYLGIARGSSEETLGHLRVACDKNYITEEELKRVGGIYEELIPMLTAFIRYLRRCDYKDRW